VCADNIARTVTIEELMRDALILAIKADFDVYNALDIFQNGDVLKELKFGIGDGRLQVLSLSLSLSLSLLHTRTVQYYIYNWRTAEVSAPEVGLVLL
jgi:glycylpeptide N-tetradecanoyltransferase